MVNTAGVVIFRMALELHGCLPLHTTEHDCPRAPTTQPANKPGVGAMVVAWTSTTMVAFGSVITKVDSSVALVVVTVDVENDRLGMLQDDALQQHSRWPGKVPAHVELVPVFAIKHWPDETDGG